jgi:hypothetical protein
MAGTGDPDEDESLDAFEAKQDELDELLERSPLLTEGAPPACSLLSCSPPSPR